MDFTTDQICAIVSIPVMLALFVFDYYRKAKREHAQTFRGKTHVDAPNLRFLGLCEEWLNADEFSRWKTGGQQSGYPDALRVERGTLQVRLRPWMVAVEVQTGFDPARPKLPFWVTQDPIGDSSPTGDAEFDRVFCTHISRNHIAPSASMRRALIECTEISGHQKTELRPEGMITVASCATPEQLAKVIRLQEAVFEAYALDPPVAHTEEKAHTPAHAVEE